MVLGKREISLILLVFGGVISIYMALLADSTSAQGGGTTGGTTNQDDEGCANPQLVDTFSGTENQITPEFETTGNTFRLSFETTLIDSEGFGGSLDIEVLDESGQPIGQGPLVFDEVQDSENILVGPGIFALDIRADNVEYTVTVEDCVGTEPTTLQPTTPQQSQNGQAQNEPTIINIPNKPLPPTGGLPVYGMVAGSVLAGVSLLGLGIGIRRGQRR